MADEILNMEWDHHHLCDSYDLTRIKPVAPPKKGNDKRDVGVSSRSNKNLKIALCSNFQSSPKTISEFVHIFLLLRMDLFFWRWGGGQTQFPKLQVNVDALFCRPLSRRKNFFREYYS